MQRKINFGLNVEHTVDETAWSVAVSPCLAFCLAKKSLYSLFATVAMTKTRQKT